MAMAEVQSRKRRVRDLNTDTQLSLRCFSHADILSSREIKDLADALEVNRTLTWLDLGENSIGTADALKLAKSLSVRSHVYVHYSSVQVNCTLTTLNLESNLIESEGASAIAESLKVKCDFIKLLNSTAARCR